MTTQTNPFQSRWGFHPAWQTLYDFHRWHRWQRKDEQNRKGPEPQYCPLFVEDLIWYKPVMFRGVEGCKVYPKTVTDRGVVELYHSARMPQPEPVEPFDEETTRRIESLYQKVKS